FREAERQARLVVSLVQRFDRGQPQVLFRAEVVADELERDARVVRDRTEGDAVEAVFRERVCRGSQQSRAVARVGPCIRFARAHAGRIAAFGGQPGASTRAAACTSFPTRRFTHATGMSPLEYVHALRLEETKLLLETTDMA